MTAIWHNDETGWRLLAPSGFPDEHALHGLVADAPQILPLAGTPRLTVVGREVLLGGNYADLLAVEPSGRLVVLEIKLARNAEARRAVVAQILTYAAFLRGLDPGTLERDVLGPHIRKLGHDGLAAAVEADDQEGAFDPTAFAGGLAASLDEGRFRLVLVLDEAPEELARLVGYLGSVADKLLIDLVTVTSYDIGGSQVVVPQRIDPERRPAPGPSASPAHVKTTTAKSWSSEGAQGFLDSIDRVPEDQRPGLRRLATWATKLEHEGLARLATVHGTGNSWTLLPRLPIDGVGLVTIWNSRGASLQFWHSVFVRRAPASLPIVETIIAPHKIGQGTTTVDISDALLEALTGAYREAAGGSISGEGVGEG
ncbi:MAG: hypothetical protein M3Q10_09975 [Chloroflexota bacterium]|nr:hypothetical protein [Chloroflexota bacterium]